MLPFLFCLLLVAACANNGVNVTKRGPFVFSGGVFEQERWSDKLVFERNSWYRGLTLVFETNLARLDESSPFNKWFSIDERRRVAECRDFIVGISYSMDVDLIPHSLFRSEMDRNGYRELTLPHFSEQLKGHPDSIQMLAADYKIQGYCSKTERKAISLNFPGFRTVIVE
jgi:hypothetical protein